MLVKLMIVSHDVCMIPSLLAVCTLADGHRWLWLEL